MAPPSCRTIRTGARPSRAALSGCPTRPGLASPPLRAPIWLRHSKVREKTPRFVQVALPLPLFQNFTYAVEDGLSNPVVVGSRVVVPLRNGREIGICVGM